jgi:hypothetical protein
MGGTPHGLVNARILAARINDDANRDAFAIVAAFLDHLATAPGGSYTTRIASYWGSGGTGFDRTGGSNPSGENAFGVWRLNTSAARTGGGSALGAMYIFVAWADVSAPSGWLINSGTADGVGIVVAFLEDGNSPWNGTTNDNGADTKGTPLWVPGGSTLHVLERSCNAGGDDATNRENTRPAIQDKGSAVTTDHHVHCIADADNIAIIAAKTSATYGSQFAVWGMGLYTMLDIVDSPTAYAALSFMDNGFPLALDTDMGQIAGSSVTNGGGFVTPASGDGVHKFGYSFTYTGDTAANPNVWSAGGAVFDESAIQIHLDTGRVGYLDTFFRHGYGMDNESFDSTNQRVAVGSVIVAEDKLTLPWPTTIGEAPGATRTEDGVTF